MIAISEVINRRGRRSNEAISALKIRPLQIAIESF